MADQLGAGPEHDVPGTIRRLPSGAVYVKRRVRNPRHAIYGAWVAVGSVGECGVVALHDEELNGSVITGTVLGGPTACPSTGAAAEHLDPTDCPIGTVLVDPDTGRWAVRFDCGDDTGKGQHVWLAPAGVLASGARFLHHAEVRGWQVGEARRWRLADDTPAVDGDVRRRAISALTELVSEFISPDEFGGYDIHYGELVDVVLAEVQPELDHLGTYKETAPVLAAMVDDLRAELRHRNRAYGRASETIGHLRAEQAHYREKLRIAHEAIERATRHRAAAQGIVMYVVDTLGLPVNTVGDAAAIGQALRELKSELARQRESRLAWAIEADRLDAEVPELTNQLESPPVVGDLRQRIITALSEQVSEFISPNEFGGYDPHYDELTDIALVEVQPELGRQAAEIQRLADEVARLTRELGREKKCYRTASEGRQNAWDQLRRIAELMGVEEDDIEVSAVAGEVERYVDQVKLVTDRLTREQDEARAE